MGRNARVVLCDADGHDREFHPDRYRGKSGNAEGRERGSGGKRFFLFIGREMTSRRDPLGEDESPRGHLAGNDETLAAGRFLGVTLGGLCQRLGQPIADASALGGFDSLPRAQRHRRLGGNRGDSRGSAAGQPENRVDGVLSNPPRHAHVLQAHARRPLGTLFHRRTLPAGI